MKEQNDSVMEMNKMIDNRKALEVKVIRNCKDGLQIYFQSNLDWSFLRAEPNEKLKNIGKVPCFYPKNDRLPDIPGFFSGEGWEADEYPNLWLLLAKDLDKGVTFKFGAIPVSEEKILKWIDRLKEQVKTIYLTLMKPVNVSVTFSTSTVEHDTND